MVLHWVICWERFIVHLQKLLLVLINNMSTDCGTINRHGGMIVVGSQNLQLKLETSEMINHTKKSYFPIVVDIHL